MEKLKQWGRMRMWQRYIDEVSVLLGNVCQIFVGFTRVTYDFVLINLFDFSCCHFIYVD